MKSKILQEFKTNHSNLGLSDTILEAHADAISKIVTDEKAIPEVVKTFADSLKVVQSESDRLRTEIAKLKQNPQPSPQPTPQPTEQKVELPSEVKQFMEEMKASQEKAKQNETLATLRREAKEELVKKGIKESLCDMYLNDISYLEGLTKENVVGTIEKKHNVFLSETLGQNGRVSNTVGGGATAVTEIKELMEKKKAQFVSEKDYANKFKNS
mgnify:CR=1 FL=1